MHAHVHGAWCNTHTPGHTRKSMTDFRNTRQESLHLPYGRKYVINNVEGGKKIKQKAKAVTSWSEQNNSGLVPVLNGSTSLVNIFCRCRRQDGLSGHTRSTRHEGNLSTVSSAEVSSDLEI